MSNEGKMRRGSKWYNFRDINGNLPEDITKDENKMKDVNYFLKNKAEEVKETKSKKEK